MLPHRCQEDRRFSIKDIQVFLESSGRERELKDHDYKNTGPSVNKTLPPR